MKRHTLLYMLALALCFLLGCAVSLGLSRWDGRAIRPLRGGQVWDQSAFGFTLRVPEDAVIADHTRANAEQGGNALHAASAQGKDGALYLFVYANETGDRLDQYPDQDVVTHYMNAGATAVRTRILGGRRFVCYRATVLTTEGEQTWDTYETWDEALQISFETQMPESAVLPMLATLDFAQAALPKTE